MTADERARQLIAAGEPLAALEALQPAIRANAADPKLRVFLFQLLAVLGQWQRALTQLQVCADLDPAALAMVATYREAIQCEALREAVFAGRNAPHAMGKPQAWVAWLAEALQADARGDAAVARALRTQALNEAPAVRGTVNGEPFDWIADADSRLGPVLEAVINGRYCWVPMQSLRRVTLEQPVDLRDLVWTPASLEFANGGGTVALIPSRYAGSAQATSPALQMARRTEWEEIGPDHYRGLGQRMWVTNVRDIAILEVREIVLEPLDESDTVTVAAD